MTYNKKRKTFQLSFALKIPWKLTFMAVKIVVSRDLNFVENTQNLQIKVIFILFFLISSTRDVALLGTCDEGCLKLAELLGWKVNITPIFTDCKGKTYRLKKTS